MVISKKAFFWIGLAVAWLAAVLVPTEEAASGEHAPGSPVKPGQYKEVKPEELGLRIEYDLATAFTKHSDEPARADTFYYDVTITNSADTAYTIEKIVGITPHGRNEISPVTIRYYCGTNIIPSKGKFVQPDRSASKSGNVSWPFVVKDIYFLVDNEGHRFRISSSKSIPVDF